ncbi:MAG: transposase [Syntrophobacterales bacterium]|nr:MAG: transposase [Syntrophobacterales bacterium]
MAPIRSAGKTFFITFNVHGKRPLFRNPKACSFFLHTLRYYKPQLKFQLLGYVVMEDHIHLMMRTPLDVKISTIIQKIKGAFGRKWKMMSQWKGPVWQKSFFNSIIHDDVSLKQRLNQIHNKPVEGGLSPSKRGYTYSSARAYEEGVDDLLTDRISF